MELSEIISLVAAIISAPLSAWLTAVLLRRKYDAEVEQLRAQVEASKTDTRGDELDNVKRQWPSDGTGGRTAKKGDLCNTKRIGTPSPGC